MQNKNDRWDRGKLRLCDTQVNVLLANISITYTQLLPSRNWVNLTLTFEGHAVKVNLIVQLYFPYMISY